MKRNSCIFRLMAMMLCACMVVSHFGGIATAFAEDSVRSLNGDGVSDPVTLLAGNGSEVKGATLEETIWNYRQTYALGVAADFCVFLKDYFWPTESDAEGRVAVGGNIYTDTPWDFNYTIGAGDYWWHTPLDELLVDANGDANREGAATVILGGYLYGTLNDTYYKYDPEIVGYYSNPKKPDGSNFEKWETNRYGDGNDGTPDTSWRRKFEGMQWGDGRHDNHANVVKDATESTTKILVINKDRSVFDANGEKEKYTNTPYRKGGIEWPNDEGPYWNTPENNTDDQHVDQSVPGSSQGPWQKIDQTQTYAAQVLNFTDSYDHLYRISTELAKADNDFTVTTGVSDHINDGGSERSANENGLTTIVLTYDPTKDSDDANSLTEGVNCVYVNMTAEQWEAFKNATYVEFQNIPNLEDGPRKVVEVKDNENAGEKHDVVYMYDWNYSYIVINVPEVREIHLANLHNGDGQKFTSINGTYISRRSMEDDDHSMNNHPGVTSLLYNFPDATTVVLGNNFQGTIFAPKAHVTDEFTEEDFKDQYTPDSNFGDQQPQFLRGHLSGALIADSFKGATEFGYRPFSGMFSIVAGDLEITKQVNNAIAADAQKEFTFQVTLVNYPINGRYGDMDFTNGVATVKVKNGESKKATGILSGVHFKVEELDGNDYRVQSGIVGSALSDSATVEGDIKIDETSSVQFVNTRKVGNLVVKKSVTGDDVDPAQEFPFTVTLSEPLTGPYGEMTFTNGSCSFSLTATGSRTATGLPAGITYTVTEGTVDGYHQQSAQGTQGNITANSTATATFMNAKDKEERTATGSLTVKKTVEGNAADPTKPFSFTIALSDTTINGTYDGVTFTGGKATISLRHGDSRTITGLPVGITYTVTENDSADYVVTHNGNTGTIAEDAEATVAFINTRNETGNGGGGSAEEGTDKANGSLSVAKKVTGNGADTSKAFDFTVMLSDTSISGTYGDMTFSKGVATFKLSHGKSATATGLPAGIKYTVTEASANQDGYTTTATGDRGTIPEGDVATAIFLNAKDASQDAPQTGDNSRLGLWLALMLLAATGMFVSIRAVGRKSNGKR